jgi:hypothetical protein
MSNILEALYEERKILMERLSMIDGLISAYGGARSVVSPARGAGVLPVDPNDYPLSGTWKDKILFVIKRNNSKMSTPTLTSIISGEEKIGDPEALKKLSTTVSQYCWSMTKAGILSVEQITGKNYYSIVEPSENK